MRTVVTIIGAVTIAACIAVSAVSAPPPPPRPCVCCVTPTGYPYLTCVPMVCAEGDKQYGDPCVCFPNLPECVVGPEPEYGGA